MLIRFPEGMREKVESADDRTTNRAKMCSFVGNRR